MAGMYVPPGAVVERSVEKFTRATNRWARILRRAQGRVPTSRETHLLVMWKPNENGPHQRGEWWLSDVERVDLENISTIQQEALQDIEEAVGINVSAAIAARLLSLMRDRFPDLVDWTAADPVRESIEAELGPTA